MVERLYQVDLVYLEHYTGPDPQASELAYLQRSRIEELVRHHPEQIECLRKCYLERLPGNVRRLVQVLAEPPDAVIRAPSRREDSVPYYTGVVAAHPQAVDLTAAFSKAPDAEAAKAKDFFSFLPAISCRGLKSPLEFHRLLIIDDVISSGFTAAAIIHKLIEFGVPREATWVVAAPLLVAKHGFSSEPFNT